MVRVMIVDDHPVFRDGLATLLQRQPNLAVVSQADGQVTAMRAMRIHTVDLVLVDLTLGSGGGLSLVRSIRAEWPKLPILVLSMHDEKTHAERAFRSGAQGYVMKDQPWEELLDAIRRVIAGQYAFSQKITRQWLGGKMGGAGTASLSDREVEVFSLLGTGLRIREVGQRLKISPKTVESHVASIKKKLDIEHANQLVYRATLWRQGMESEGSVDG